ncbi:hypothetical protein N864_14615 [Intrasporangium chromatireducens Q5-1]|uniref:Uncharacterized protein n=1 Tax=Intrasporangium chromatireducens Q5-1 TaxID=584657 RepID=W9GDZ2_9MICO|nr:hypothetical protein [Intrasporangium chromatireducens]EWT04300.1 hypothetical protein N864_14615 [Intrasporangium chromatireducens Q5-1]
MILHLRAAVQQLYAASLGEFMSVRSSLVAEAKQAGERELAKQVGALRKPTVAAWALNHFVREHPDELDAFHDFAELLREAQRTLDADQLRLLSRERARRVDAVARKVESAARTAGQPISDAVGDEVRQTLTAFIADEGAEESVMTGALVKPLQYSGLGDVDIEGVAAVAPRHLKVIPGGAADEPSPEQTDAEDEAARAAEEERRRAALAAERARLERAVERAGKARRDAEHRVEVQQARVDEAREGVADLERQLATARERLAKATDELDEVSGIRDEKAEAEAGARRALEAHPED